MKSKQKKIPFSQSLEGTDEQIKLRELITECEKCGCENPDEFCKAKTGGLDVDSYLARPFNRLKYYEWKYQVQNWKFPKLNFWDL